MNGSPAIVYEAEPTGTGSCGSQGTWLGPTPTSTDADGTATPMNCSLLLTARADFTYPSGNAYCSWQFAPVSAIIMRFEGGQLEGWYPAASFMGIECTGRYGTNCLPLAATSASGSSAVVPDGDTWFRFSAGLIEGSVDGQAWEAFVAGTTASPSRVDVRASANSNATVRGVTTLTIGPIYACP